MVVRSAQVFLDAGQADSGLSQADYLAVLEPAGSVAPTADDHFVRAAVLADLAQADSSQTDCLAVLVLAGLVAPTADDHFVRPAQLADSAQAGSLAV